MSDHSDQPAPRGRDAPADRARRGSQGAAVTGPEPPAGSRRARRRDAAKSGAGGKRRVLLIGAIVLVVVIAAVVIVMVTKQRQTETQPPPPVTTTLPQPTAAGEPIDVSGDSPLAQAIPQVVVDHVLTAQEADEQAFADNGAIEAWHLTYSAPGSDIRVHLLQWEEAEDAAAYIDEFFAEPGVLVDGEGRRSGDVAVDGQPVGRYEIGVLSDQDQPAAPSTPEPSDAEPVATPEPLGAGLAVWTNGTVALVAEGDAARLAQFYDNFPF